MREPRPDGAAAADVRSAHASGATIDRALEDLVRRLSGDPLVARSAALASRERGLGHVCVHLADHAGSWVRGVEETFRWPPPDEWKEALRASPMVLAAEDVPREEPGRLPPLAPLVLDDFGRLYLYRYYRAEDRLARRILRVVEEGGGLETAAADDLLGVLFPEASENDVGDAAADQAKAARTALRSPLALVSGGPGTGKTTTVARILVLLLAAEPDLRVSLAAPTGKAAARLGEAIREKLEEMEGALPETAQGILERVPREARTLHRLLGYSPSRDRFRHRAEEPLACDLLVVDEASMVDLLLMDALLDALPSGARLVLLGDRDQLASVEAGFVFGDLARAAGLGADTAAESDPPLAGCPLAGYGVELRKSWRFADRPGIGELASAIRAGDLDRALAILDDDAYPEVGRIEPPASPVSLLEGVEEEILRQVDATGTDEALESADRFRILCATRVGRHGVERLNALAEDRLRRAGRIERTDDAGPWYEGRPILVQENDYRVDLFNGDLGVCRRRGGRLWAFFPSLVASEGPRPVPLGKLPRHDTAWAMTVHKSQGSEVDRVLLVLPDDADAAGGILGRELLYTGVTRARRRVEIVSSVEVLGASVARTSRRESGLVDALRRAGSA